MEGKMNKQKKERKKEKTQKKKERKAERKKKGSNISSMRKEAMIIAK